MTKIPKRKFQMLDLFSGIGGFALAAQWVWGESLEVVSFCEINKFCQKILNKYWPKVPIHNDIKTLDGKQWRGTIDLITGGFPCQNLSVAGKREGLKGEDSGLFFEMERVVAEVLPKWIVIENVPGLLSSHKGKDMAYIIGTLSEIGYCVGWRVLDAQYFGVAQRRRRLFIVGSLGNISAFEVLFESKGSSRNDKAIKKMGERGLCISTRDGGKQDPTNKALVACTVGTIDGSNGTKGGGTNLVAQRTTAAPRGNSSFVRQDTYIAEVDSVGERKADGVSRRLDNNRGKALGSAVVPQVVTQILRRIALLKQNNDKNETGGDCE